MNITLIHIVEIITLLLVVGKAFQIWRLYRAATFRAEEIAKFKKASRLHASKQNHERRQYLTPEEAIESELYRQFRSNHSSQKLPLPEVSFTEGLPLPVVSYAESDMIQPTPELAQLFRTKKVHANNVAQVKDKAQAKVKAQASNQTQVQNTKPEHAHKRILNDYIEDLFYESKPDYFSAEVLEFKDYKIDSTAEDEFITVDDEHAEFVRAFDSLDANLCLAR